MNISVATRRLALAAMASLACFTATAQSFSQSPGQSPSQSPNPPPTQTPTQELYRSGLWSAYRGADERGPFCGVSTGGVEGRRVAVQQSASESGIAVLLSKSSWAIPDNTPIAVQFRFDGRGEGPSQARGRGQTIAAQLNFEQSVSFMRALRNGRVLQVIFPDGNETIWTGGLSGSGNAINAFNNCRASLAPAEPTQPFRTEPSAPQSPPPQPTQPYARPSPVQL